MADNTATIKVNVVSSGDEDLAKNAAHTAASYKSVEKSLAAAAATSKRVPVANAAAKAAARMDNEEYGRARGTVGSTGAAGRDFSNQAQGLGGLVHLYATFAANIFAAGAAFRALSNAMDTTNMVKGLDQLGAAAGRNLGYISKALVQVTDGAVSMREAMEATAKASAAGLSNDQIMRLGAAAKNASQALGLSMPDALSRLSRGISKIEPELLDELGIFVRVDDAVAQYARSVGKAAATVTDFEKRQAFANAVLTQAEQKFNSIKIDSNPYTKMAASLSNAVQQGLELVNKVLTPIANILASSPTALITALGLVISMLVKQAIPTITSFRSNLAKSAEAANAAAAALAQTRKQKFEIRDDKKIDALNTKSVELTNNIKNVQKELNKNIEGGMFKRPTLAMKAFSGALDDITTKDIANAERRLKDVQSRLGSFEGPPTVKNKEKQNTLLAEESFYKRIIPLAKERLKVEQLVNEETGKPIAGRYSALSLNVERYIKLQQKALSASIVSNAAENAATYGVRAAWGLLTEEVSRAKDGFKKIDDQFVKTDTKMGALRATMTTLRGGVAAVTTYTSMLVQSIAGTLLPILGVLSVAYAGLSYIFSKNGKEAAILTEKIDALSSATKTLANTTELYISKQLSSQAIIAKANAFGEVANSVEQTVKALKEADLTASWFDKHIDGWLTVVGKSIKQKTAKEISMAIIKALDSMPDNLRNATQLDLAKILNVDASAIKDFKNLNKIVEDIPDEQAVYFYDKLSKVISKANIESKKFSQSLEEIKSKNVALKRATEDLMQSFISRDPINNFAIALVDSVTSYRTEIDKLDKSYKDSKMSAEDSFDYVQKSLSLLNDVLDNTSLTAFLSSDDVKTLTSYKNTLIEITKNLNILSEAQDGARKSLEGVLKEQANMVYSVENDKEAANSGLTSSFDVREMKAFSAKIAIARQNLLNEAGKNINVVREVFSDFSTALGEGYSLIFKKITDAYSKAKLTVDKQAVSFVSGFGSAAQNTSLEKRAIDLQIKNIETMDRLINVNQLAILAQEADMASREKQGLEAKNQKTPEDEQKIKGLGERLTAIREAGKVVSNFSKISYDGLSNLAKSLLPLSFILQKVGKAAEVIDLDAQKRAADIRGKQGSALEQVAVNDKIRQNALETYNIEKDRLKTLSSIVGITSTELNNLIYSYEIGSANLSNAIQIASINEKIAAYEDNKANLSGEELRRENEKIDIIKRERDDLIRINKEKVTNLELEKQIANIKIETDNKLKDLDLAVQQRKDIENIVSAQLELSNVQLTAAQSMGTINETILIRQKAINEQRALELETANKLKDAEDSRLRTILEIAQKSQNARMYIESRSDMPIPEKNRQLEIITTQESQELDRVNSRYRSIVASIESINTAKGIGIKLTEEATLYTQKWDDTFKSIAASTLSLTALFGEMGAKIGLATEGIAKLGQILEQNAAKEADALKRRDEARNAYNKSEQNGDNVDERYNVMMEAEEAYAKQRRKSAKDEISAAAATAGGIKNLFKEKTAAYKAFAALEKAMHIARITMDVIEMASDIKKALTATAAAGTEQAASFGSMIVKGGEAVINAMKSLPVPFNFAAGAAMAAAVAAVISSVGGSGGPATPSAGISMADRQEVQGTGQRWESGVKVNTAYGVFGDSEAKIENIDKSLEIVRDKSIQGLPLFNAMVYLLESIDRGINNTAKAIYTANIGKAFEGLNTTSAAFDIPVIGKFLGSVFGGNKSETLIDWGIKFGTTAGTTFLDLVQGKGISQYATVAWEKSGGWFSKDKSGIDERLENLNPKVMKGMQAIFENAAKTFGEIYTFLGKNANDITAVLAGIKLDESVYLSLKDLKGEDLEKELSAVVGQLLNEATVSLFKFAEEYVQFGEDVFTALIRIVDTNQKVNYALKNIGIDFEGGLTDSVQRITKTVTETFISGYQQVWEQVDYWVHGGGDSGSWMESRSELIEKPIYSTREVEQAEYVGKSIKELSIEITESLVEMAGGMEEFAKGINFFMENFLTEEERREILTRNVTNEVSRLGGTQEYIETLARADVSALDSVESFKLVVRALDLTSEDGRRLYTDLMNLAPAFHELYAAGASAEEAANKIAELTAQLYRLQGRTDEAIAIEREKALSDLKTEEEKSLQQQIWVLEDELKLRKLNVDLMTAEGKTFEALLANREEELRVLTDAERVLKRQVYAAQDAAKSQALDIRLLELQGEYTLALTLKREKELLSLSDIIDASGKSDRIRQEEIWALEEAGKMRSMDIELLTAQGYAQEALALTRAEEIRNLTEEQKLKKQQIYDAQDAAKNMSLYLEYLKASGKTGEAIARERAQNLRSASTKVDSVTGVSDRQLLAATYAAEDLAKQRALEIELMDAQGYGYNSLIMSRKAELRTLTASEKILKKQVYAAQDAMKTQGLQIQLMRAMGNETGALAAERELELRNLSETDQAIQKLIWQYEDQKEAADKLKSSLESVTDSLRDSIKSLQDYKKELLMGEESPLSTGQKYQTAKNDILSLLNTISAPAETEEQLRAQSDAVSKLQGTSSTFLELSRKMFASSGQYTNDFNWILGILDSATGMLEDQLTDAEKQLAAIEKGNEYLASLNSLATQLLTAVSSPVNYDEDDTSSISDPIVNKLTDVYDKLNEIVVGPLSVQLSESTGLENVETKTDFFENTLTEVSSVLLAQFEQETAILTKLDEMFANSITANSIFESYSMSIASNLEGVLNVMSSLGSIIQDTFISQISNLQVDTRNIEAAVYNVNNVNTPILQAMVDQLRVLNEKVTQLETTTAEIGILNIEATKENTNTISNNIIEGVATNLYSPKLIGTAKVA